MIDRCRPALLALLLPAILLATFSIGRSGDAPAPLPVRFRTGDFFPPPDLDLGGGPSTRSHRLIQFSTLPGAEARAVLEAAGIELLEYLPERAFIVSLPGGLPPDHPALVGAVYAGPLAARDKISPYLTAAAVDRAGPDGRLEVAVRFHRDLAPGEGRLALQRHGFESREGAHAQTLVRLTPGALLDLAEADEVLLVHLPRPRLVHHNDDARNAALVSPLHQSPYDLDGTGTRLGIWDGTVVDVNHPDLSGRVTVGPGETPVASCASNPDCLHATHVLGTAAGDGSRSQFESGAPLQWRGMAPAASIVSYEFNDAPTELRAAANLDEAQNSWGYCIDATDPLCAPCDTFGDYVGWASEYDDLVRTKPVVVVFSAGNSRNDTGIGCDLLGFPYRNWETLTPPGTAKNVIAVGAVNSNDLSMTPFSSWGPTDDGRIKPDLVAPGCEYPRNDGHYSGSIWSIRGGAQGYEGRCGTSMAAPVVSGGAALLFEDVRARTGLPPAPHTVKAVLIHTAADLDTALGTQPGPDYASGWGLVQVRAAVDTLRGDGVFTGQVSSGQQVHFEIEVPAAHPELRATLAWDDRQASPLAIDTLVNDLDLVVTSPTGNRAFPWTLPWTRDDELDYDTPAENDEEENHTDNVEQVLVTDPEPGTWTLAVRGTSVPFGPQAFTLAGDPAPGFVPFSLAAPAEGTEYHPDAPPATFSWIRGVQQQFKVQWSRSSSFGTPRKSSGKTWLIVDEHTPDSVTWNRILRLGKTTGTVYWRVKAKDAGGALTLSETRTIEVAAAEPAEITEPADGDPIPASSPPTLEWEANHNAVYKVIFAPRSDMGGKPKAKSGKGYTLTGTSWPVPADVWNKIVTRLAPKNPEGRVWYTLYSKDALNRKTQDTVRSFTVTN